LNNKNIIISLSNIKKAMKESDKDTFLIDGFPRNKDNLTGWNRQVGAAANVKATFFFECSEQICVERCLERGKSSGRSDDNEASLALR
jgi:UMP-CMP kinase